jgi:inhibitor of KinA sporulation pathway (predicted exonuclease)
MTISSQNDSTLGESPFVVVYDLEFTAWDGSMARKWLAPGEFKEVVQIGAVKVDGAFSPLVKLNLLIRPRLNPQLSDYLQTLTGIDNDAVAAHGIDFADAYRTFAEFAGPLPIVAFGRDDLVLADNLRLYGLKAEPAMPHPVDIRSWLMENGIDVRGLHACDVGPAAGVPFDGHTHDGLADALSVAAGVQALMARGAPCPDIVAPEIYP